MSKNIRYVGLDVHAATIHVAIAEGREQPRSLGVIENRPEAIRRLFKKLGDTSTLRVCYEAGPTGYVLYWQLTKLGIHCEVVAPSLIPRKPAERIKTDRRDAMKLALPTLREPRPQPCNVAARTTRCGASYTDTISATAGLRLLHEPMVTPA